MTEKIKLIICIPTAGKVHCAFAFSLAGLMGRLSQGITTRPDAELQLNLDLQQSSCIHSNREMLVRRAIDGGYSHLCFIDDDMGFDSSILNVMLGRRQPVVATNYLIKHQPPADPEFVAVGLNGRRIITREQSTGLQEIAYSGFGFSLFETEVFKKTPQPWFQPRYVEDAGSYTTEDLPCFEAIRNAGFKCYVDHEASKLVTHHGDSLWRWDQWKRPPQPEVKIAEGA